MRGVSCGSGRYPFDRDECWHHYPTEGFWGYECEAFGDYTVEFTIRGGPAGPEPDRLEVAERVAAHLAAFVDAAQEYLASFVNPALFQGRSWSLQGVEFGLHPVHSPDVFEVQLMLAGNESALWGVQFLARSLPLEEFIPTQFRRQQR